MSLAAIKDAALRSDAIANKEAINSTRSALRAMRNDIKSPIRRAAIEADARRDKKRYPLEVDVALWNRLIDAKDEDDLPSMQAFLSHALEAFLSNRETSKMVNPDMKNRRMISSRVNDGPDDPPDVNDEEYDIEGEDPFIIYEDVEAQF